nr:hypothetical protein GCM10020093_026550 [Planobispora longispora]
MSITHQIGLDSGALLWCGAPGDSLESLIETFAGHDADDLIERVVAAAATVCSTGYAGLVEVDPVEESAVPVHVHVPPGDPLRVRRWLRDGAVLKTLATRCRPVFLPGTPPWDIPVSWPSRCRWPPSARRTCGWPGAPSTTGTRICWCASRPRPGGPWRRPGVRGRHPDPPLDPRVQPAPRPVLTPGPGTRPGRGPARSDSCSRSGPLRLEPVVRPVPEPGRRVSPPRTGP